MIRYTQFFSFVSLSLFSLLLFFFDFIYSAKKESVHLKQCRRVVLAMTISRLRNGFERSGASGAERSFASFFFRSWERESESEKGICAPKTVPPRFTRDYEWTERYTDRTIYDLRFTITIYDLRFTQSLSPFFCFISFYEYGSDGALYTQAMCSPKLNHLIAEGT